MNRMNVSTYEYVFILHSVCLMIRWQHAIQCNATDIASSTVCKCGTDVVQAVPITTGGDSVGALMHIMH